MDLSAGVISWTGVKIQSGPFLTLKCSAVSALRTQRTKESYWSPHWWMISCRGLQDGADCINNLTLKHACFLSVSEKCDVTKDSADIVLHYKVNPYVNRPTDGLTCWLQGGFWWEGGRNVWARANTDNWKKKKKKSQKNVSCSDVIRKAKAEL